VWADLATDAAQAKRLKERKDDKVKAHVTERNEFRFWDHWLTDGREPHIMICDVETGRCRDILAGTAGDPSILRLLPAFILQEEHVDRLRAALVDL